MAHPPSNLLHASPLSPPAHFIFEALEFSTFADSTSLVLRFGWGDIGRCCIPSLSLYLSLSLIHELHFQLNILFLRLTQRFRHLSPFLTKLPHHLLKNHLLWLLGNVYPKPCGGATGYPMGVSSKLHEPPFGEQGNTSLVVETPGQPACSIGASGLWRCNDYTWITYLLRV